MRLTPVFFAAASAALGFYFLFRVPHAVIIVIFSLSLIVLCFFRVLSSLNSQSKKLQLTAVYSFVIAIGLCAGVSAASAGQAEIKFGITENDIIAIEGILKEDPRIISGRNAMVTLSLKKSASKGGLRVSSSGEILVFFPELNAETIKQFGRGADVYAEGKLRSNDRGTYFNAVSLHVVKPAPSIERMRTNIRLSLISRFEKKTGSVQTRNNWNGLALALLLGIRDNLDSEFTEMFRNAGLSYILSLSGMHLAIITALIAFLLKKPLGLKISAGLSALIIILYCFLVGPTPSLIRAMLMYLLGVITIIFALPKKAMSVLALSFLLQIVITPHAGNSLSFILSYLALLGILVIAKAISSIFAGKIPEFILQPVSVSCGAFLATAGICSLTFGTLAPIGIIAGLLIVPLTTVFMIGSIIWLFLDLFAVSGFFSYPMSWLYNLMESIALIAGKTPGLNLKPGIVIVLSLAISIFVIVFNYFQQKRLLHIDTFN